MLNLCAGLFASSRSSMGTAVRPETIFYTLLCLTRMMISRKIFRGNVNPSVPGRTVCRDTYSFGCSVWSHHACKSTISARVCSQDFVLPPSHTASRRHLSTLLPPNVATAHGRWDVFGRSCRLRGETAGMHTPYLKLIFSGWSLKLYHRAFISIPPTAS
jgi:hypothetical protein